MDLYEIEEGGQGKILKSTTVDSKWTGYIIESIGDISYKNGLLCWSTYENIFCEPWPRTGSAPAVSHVLHKGDARSVCGDGKSFLVNFQWGRVLLRNFEIIT